MLKFLIKEVVAIFVFIAIYSIDVFSYVRFNRSLDEYFFPKNFFSDNFMAILFIAANFITFGTIAYKSFEIKGVSPSKLRVLKIVAATLSIFFHTGFFVAYIIWFRLEMGLSL